MLSQLENRAYFPFVTNLRRFGRFAPSPIQSFYRLGKTVRRKWHMQWEMIFLSQFPDLYCAVYLCERSDTSAHQIPVSLLNVMLRILTPKNNNDWTSNALP
jgi:hypothetical protein